MGRWFLVSPAESETTLKIWSGVSGNVLFIESPIDANRHDNGPAIVRKGICKFVFRNDDQAREISLHFPPAAIYCQTQENVFNPLPSDKWPEFARENRSVSLAREEVVHFTSEFQLLCDNTSSWDGIDYMFVFANRDDEEHSSHFTGCVLLAAEVDQGGAKETGGKFATQGYGSPKKQVGSIGQSPSFSTRSGGRGRILRGLTNSKATTEF